MRHLLLSVILLWLLTGHSQATLETCQGMGLYFCTECQNSTLQCSTCSPGYTLNSNNTSCENCGIDKCNICESSSNNTFTCTSCIDGYYLDSNNSCIACSDTNCAKCTDSTCNICNDGYYLDSSNTCTACDFTNCMTCNSSACGACNAGYYLFNSTTCEECSVDNCMMCDQNNCTACKEGYYLNSGACEACPSNCVACNSVTTCTKCNDTFYLDDKNTCQSTSLFGAECLDATLASPICTTCQTDAAVTLIDNKCLKNCTLCGTYDDTTPTSLATDCNNANGEYTNITYCEYGCAIMVGYVNGDIVYAARGCSNDTCTSEGAEQCTNPGPNQICVTCCSQTALCNSDYYKPSSSPPTNHPILLSVMLVAMVAGCVMI